MDRASSVYYVDIRLFPLLGAGVEDYSYSDDPGEKRRQLPKVFLPFEDDGLTDRQSRLVFFRRIGLCPLLDPGGALFRNLLSPIPYFGGDDDYYRKSVQLKILCIFQLVAICDLFLEFFTLFHPDRLADRALVNVN